MYTYLTHRYLLVFYFTCLLVLGTISKSSAQNLSIYPNHGVRDRTLTITISSTTVQFQQGSATVCPSKLNVNASNVVLQQGSTTMTINPTSISTNNGVITAFVDIPN